MPPAARAIKITRRPSRCRSSQASREVRRFSIHSGHWRDFCEQGLPLRAPARNRCCEQRRRGWDCSRPGTPARPPLRSGPPRLRRDVQRSLRDFCRTRVGSSTRPTPPNKKGLRQHGQPILNEAIGRARGFRRDEVGDAVPVLSQTLFPAYSAGKPLAAIAIAILEDRGNLDPLAPISKLWPPATPPVP
jgi:hypothetical protein